MKTFTEQQFIDLYLELKQPPYQNLEPGILEFARRLGVRLPSDNVNIFLEELVPYRSVISSIASGNKQAIRNWPALVQSLAIYVLSDIEAGEKETG